MRKLVKIRHPNIVSVEDWAIQNDICYILMEYVNGGELLDRIITIKQLSEKMAAGIIK